MAGVPFDAVDRLATRATSEAARELLVRQREFDNARKAVEQILQSREHGLAEKGFRAWRRAVRSGAMPSALAPPAGPFAHLLDCAARFSSAQNTLAATLENELPKAREALLEEARNYLPAYLVFASAGVRDRVIHQLAAATLPLPPRNKQARADERHLLLYLQRISAKNDSLSAFGPEGWGTIDPQGRGIHFQPEPGIAARETFLERWTAHGAAAAVNADPEVRIELAPRLNPLGRLEGRQFIFTDTGETKELDAETLAALEACGAGNIPAHSLGIDPETLAACARENLLRWELEVPALEPYAFAQLVTDIRGWREGAARKRWLERLEPIAELPKKFAATTDIATRVALIDEATAQLEKLGTHKSASRFLYSATNAIGEECFRKTEFVIGEKLINEVAVEAAPWIDLWRDNFAFVASRVAAGLRGLLQKTPLQNGAAPLPAFLRTCAEAKMSLTGPGLVVLAHLGYQEARQKFRELFAARADLAETELTAADCHFVRQNFKYPPFDEYTYPSADLQLSATSVAAVEKGDYQWIFAEAHPPAALLHHGFYWSCPDKETLKAALTKIVGDRPSPHFGIYVADFTATTAVHLFDALAGRSSFIAPQRSNPSWWTVPPAEVEVFVDDANGDVGLRRRGTGDYLGSVARNWIIPLGFHPFGFSLGKNTPRFRCGKVVVQRRSWTVTAEELGSGDFTGVSRDLVVAVERLRTQRELPRYIYIRPSEQALRRSGAEGRDKDTKPVFIDLESYLFLEIFHLWLGKAGELEVTEMLPDPDHLLWQEKDGRRTFELRTLFVPR